MTKARALIQGASLGPSALKLAGQAFDEAWASIASHFHDPDGIEAARLALASAILSFTEDSSQDVEVLKRAGLQAMLRIYGPALPAAEEVKPLEEIHWRKRAEETRQLARFERDDAIKEELIEIAKAYDRVAEVAKHKNQPNGRKR
jgi:hypothetical protein